MAGLIGAFVSQFQLTGNVSIFSADGNQVLFKLGLGSNEGVVKSGHLSVSGCKLTQFLFSNLLGVIGLLKDLGCKFVTKYSKDFIIRPGRFRILEQHVLPNISAI